MRRTPWLLLLAAPGAALAQPIAPPPGLEPPAFEKASADFRAGRFAECQAAFASVASTTGRSGLAARAFYGAACCAAQRGARDDAFGALGLAVANGYGDVERALSDARLSSLAGDPRWVSFLSRAEEVRTHQVKSYEPTLHALWLELEAERAGRAAPPVEATAAKRIEKALAIVEGDGLRQAHDYLHAAAVLVESARAADVERAVALTRRGLELDPDLLVLRPLHAAAVDRQLLLRGEPQKFGTQSVREGASFRVYRVDPAVTDADRALWGVPPLAAIEARLAELAAPPKKDG